MRKKHKKCGLKTFRLENIEPGIMFGLARIGVFALLCIFMAILSPVFLSIRNISNVITNASVLVILGVGETITIVAAGTDLSLGSILTITSVIAVILLKAGVPYGLAMVVALLFGLILGLINGLLIAKIKLPPFISTYGLQWAIFGFAYVILRGYVLYDFDEKFRFIGNGYLFNTIPMPIVVMFFVVIAGIFLMRRTTLGREFYAIGANKETATMSGINVDKVVILAFSISGMLAALAGIVLVARINAVQANIGAPYLLPTIAAVFLGGTSPVGGQGGITGTVIGALIMTIVQNGMNLMGVPSVWREAIVGLMIIITLFLDIMARKRLEKVGT